MWLKNRSILNSNLYDDQKIKKYFRFAFLLNQMRQAIATIAPKSGPVLNLNNQ